MTNKSSKKSELEAYRMEIDDLDHQLIQVLKKRNDVATKIANWKVEQGVAVLDSQREKALLENLQAIASEEGVSRQLILNIYQEILKESKKQQFLVKKEFDLKDFNELSIGIVGAGVMGGSLIKRLNQVKGSSSVNFFDVNVREICIGETTLNASTLTSTLGQKLIFICLPPLQAIEFIRNNLKRFNSESIVVDMSSVQSPIVEAIEKIKPDFNFVSAHPLAGSEIKGLSGSQAEIFDETKILMSGLSREHVQFVQRFFEKLNCEPLMMSAERHDEILALTSHLPHITSLAIALASEETCSKNPEDFYLGMTKSFDSVIRMGAANEDMWSQICSLNSKAIKKELDRMIYILQGIRENLDHSVLIKELFLLAKNFRVNLKKKGRHHDHSDEKRRRRTTVA